MLEWMGFKALKYGSRFCFLWDLHPAKDWGSELGRTLLPVQIPAWMNSLPLALAELCYSHPPIPGHQSHRITFLVPLEISVLTPLLPGKECKGKRNSLSLGQGRFRWDIGKNSSGKEWSGAGTAAQGMVESPFLQGFKAVCMWHVGT